MAGRRVGGNPNAGGAGAKNIRRTLEASLKRLGTDYIDLYWMHVWDGVTPVEEIVQTLGDLVRAGQIRSYLVRCARVALDEGRNDRFRTACSMADCDAARILARSS